jgi:hypothetical protein
VNPLCLGALVAKNGFSQQALLLNNLGEFLVNSWCLGALVAKKDFSE